MERSVNSYTPGPDDTSESERSSEFKIRAETKQKHRAEIKRRHQYIEFPSKWLGYTSERMMWGWMTIRERGIVEVEQNGEVHWRPYGILTFRTTEILFLHDGTRWIPLDYRAVEREAENQALPQEPKQEAPSSSQSQPMVYPYKHPWADRSGVSTNATETDILIDLLWKFTWECFIRSTGSKR
jgi:hypothetical protein